LTKVFKFHQPNSTPCVSGYININGILKQ